MRKVIFLWSVFSLQASEMPPESHTIEHTKPAADREQSPAYIRNYLEQQYRHKALQKPITLTRKTWMISDLLECLAHHAGLSLLSHVASKTVLPAVAIIQQPIGEVLHTLLSGHKPPLAILIVDGVLHVGPRARIARRAQHLIGGGHVACESAAFTLADTAWTETMKLRLEAMWYQCTREHIGSARRQYFFLDEGNHQVLVQGAPEQIKQFRSFILAINKPLPQVRIEARVVTCTNDLLESLGINAALYAQGRTRDPVKITAQPTAMTSSSVDLPLVIGGTSETARHLDILLRAAERRHAVQTLLSPQLLAQHGKSAQLLEGQRVPIESVTEESNEGKVKQIRSATYKEVGMQLKVTPRVLSDRTRVQLDVLVENSHIAHTSTSSSYPTFTTSHIKNSVVLQSGQLVVLGGLIRRVHKQERTGVPFLCRLPFFGSLFRGTSQEEEEQRLYVLLRATLVDR